MDFMMLAQQCAPMVAPRTLMTIVRAESGFRPYAIGVNGKSRLTRQPQTQAEAIAVAINLIGKGISIDLGLAQINSANLPVLGLSIEDAFDPCKNLNAAARLLQSDYQRALSAGYLGDKALVAALSTYNTGSFTKGINNGYVRKVLSGFSETTNLQLFFGGNSQTVSFHTEPTVSPFPAKRKALPGPATSGVMVYAVGSHPYLIFQP